MPKYYTPQGAVSNQSSARKKITRRLGNEAENTRLKFELEKRRKYSESRSNNRKKAKIDTSIDDNICKTYDKHMENEDENESIITDNNNSLFKKTLEKNEKWIHSISTQFKISDEEVILKLDMFHNHLTSEFKIHPSMNEFTKHFKNWIPVNKVKNEKPNNNKPAAGRQTADTIKKNLDNW